MLQYNKSVPAARPSDLKFNNRRQILELFKFGAVRSVAGLAGEVGVSRQTVMKSIQFFLEKGIIVSDGKADSGSMGGKRAELFKLTGDKYLLSLVVVPDLVAITLMNLRCEVIESRDLKDIDNLDGELVLEAAVEECGRMLSERGIAVSQVRGVCVIGTGIVGPEGATSQSALFPTWNTRLPIESCLRSHLSGDVRVIVESLGKVCGSAVLHDLAGQEDRVATVLTYRDDIAACLIARGQILQGWDDYVSEFGHMTVAIDDDEVCSCGSRGCLERQLSRARFEKLYRENLGRFPASRLAEHCPNVTIKDVFDASKAEDPMARHLSEYAGELFAVALRNLVLLFPPHRVVFQGDYACADPAFIEALKARLLSFKGFLREGAPAMPFKLEVDNRPLRQLCILGSYTLLIDSLFADEENYA